MTLCSDPIHWPAPWREHYAERAAIMEHDGGQTAAEAARNAEFDIRRVKYSEERRAKGEQQKLFEGAA